MKKLQISVLIAEDEPIILKHICKKIEDLNIGITVVATAMNGKEALKKIYDFHPDFIMTDIRMPVMDGIELIRNVRTALADLPIIVLSGYSDFEYMKQCIDLSVDGYILKPINTEELKKILLKIKGIINEKNDSLAKEILTSSVMFGKKDGIMPSGLEQEEFQLMLLNVGNLGNGMLNRSQVHILNDIWEGIPWNQIMAEVLGMEYQWWIIDEYLYNQKFFLITCDERLERIHRIIHELHRKLRNYVKELPITIVYSMEKITNDQIKESADKLRNKMRESLVPCYSQCVCIENVSGNNYHWTLQDDLLCLGDINNHQNQREEFVEIGKKWNRQAVPQVKIIKNLRTFLDKLSVKEFVFYSMNTPLLMTQIEDTFVLESNVEFLYQKIWNCLISSMETDKINIKKSSDIAEIIKHYFEEHYSEDINLTKLSEEFHFTAAYLSKIFKKYTGEAPVRYLQKIRVEHAKKLLSVNNDMTIQMIALNVGYDNVHYFSRVFKSETGLTPSEYRENYQKNASV